MSPPTWRSELQRIATQLNAPHEAAVLIEEVAGKRIADLIVDIDRPLQSSELDALSELVARRLCGEPLQHVIGHWPFRNVELLVDTRALIPRPETEQVVNVALRELLTLRNTYAQQAESFIPNIVDLGVGSGAISCAIVDEVDDVIVIGIDRSSGALSLAKQNIERLDFLASQRITLYEGNWFTPIRDDREHTVDLVIANPPYLARNEWYELDPVVRDFDPYGALVAGVTGLEDLQQIIEEAPAFLRSKGVLICEIGATQGDAVRELGRLAGASSVTIETDLAGRDRIFVARFSL